MTAIQFASLLRARRVGRGKWQALCPAHPDRKPSLSIAEGKRGVLVRCMSNGCDTRDILAALGLTFNDLFYDKATPAVRGRVGLQGQRESLERQLGLVIWLGAIEKGKRAYWAAAERRIRGELELLRCKLEPLSVYREFRERQFRDRLGRLGWDRLMMVISWRQTGRPAKHHPIAHCRSAGTFTYTLPRLPQWKLPFDGERGIPILETVPFCPRCGESERG